MATYQVVSFCIIALYFVVMMRILFGPLSYNLVVLFHYGSRITMVSFVTMTTFKMFLKTLFIINFERMAAISEKNVLVCLVLVTFFCTSAHIAEEIFIRQFLGLDHFARFCFNMYFAKVVLQIFFLKDHLMFIIG